MTVLLDVNVLVALIDPGHVFHDVAHDWFATRAGDWATCPLTENGVVRVISQPRYPNSTGTPATAIEIVRGLCALPGHVFWPDTVSLLDPHLLDSARLSASGQVTDSYLLALAIANSGRLATFDRRMAAAAIPGGESAVLVLGPGGRR